jgi:hypothetical protein
VRHFPTERPVVDVHLEQLDTVFELADSSLLHLEFQTARRRETLLRFLQYDVGLSAQYQRNIHTMVIYGAGISSAPETLNFGVVQYDVRNVFLGRDDGEETYQRLRARVASGSALEPEERLDLVFLPLTHNARPPVDVVSGALALAQQLPVRARGGQARRCAQSADKAVWCCATSVGRATSAGERRGASGCAPGRRPCSAKPGRVRADPE